MYDYLVFEQWKEMEIEIRTRTIETDLLSIGDTIVMEGCYGRVRIVGTAL
jgi:hypothetical protein